MGVLVDIVPNHVGVATPHLNAWWWDLLRHGRASRARRCLRRRLGRSAAVGSGSPWSATTTCSRTAGSLTWPSSTASSATTTTAIPIAVRGDGSPRRPVDDRRRDGPRPAALRAGQLAARPTTSSTTDASSRSTPWPAIRVEDRAVFDASHVEIRRWFDEGLVDGLRVDHPDGLRDPAAYLDDLATLTGGAYVLVEKILEPGESLEPRLGDGRHHRVRRPRPASTGCSPTRPGASRSPRSRLACTAAAFDWARADPRHQARRRRRHPRLGGAPGRARGRGEGWCRDRRRRRRARWRASRSTAPTCPAGREHLDAALADARRRRPDLADDLRRPRARAGRPGRTRGPALPADQRHGDGQGRRGLCVLPRPRGSPR